MQTHMDDELQVLRGELLAMGGLCERMIALSSQALLEADLSQTGAIMALEDQVNTKHIEVDELCMRLLALQGPLARDLRSIIAALKINNDLERIGDQACNIAQNTMDLLKAPRSRLPEDMRRMAGLAGEMVRDALNAYVKADPALAERALAHEEVVDSLKDQIFNAQLDEMRKDASTVQKGMDIILIARNFEKIGDHATNIAEDVIFMVKGKDIRHHRQE